MATSYETRKPCRTASSLLYSVQNKSLRVSTLCSAAAVSVAVKRKTLERLLLDPEKVNDEREASDPVLSPVEPFDRRNDDGGRAVEKVVDCFDKSLLFASEASQLVEGLAYDGCHRLTVPQLLLQCSR